MNRENFRPPLRFRQDVNRLRIAACSLSKKAPSDPVFVLATARTGSTLLVNYMNCLPGVQVQGEWIHTGGGVGIHEGAATKHVLRHVGRSLAAGDTPVRGAKLLLRGLQGRGLTLDDLRAEFPEVRFVVLWRRAIGAQYISGELAKATGRWHATGTTPSGDPQIQLEVSREHLTLWIKRLEALYADVMAVEWATGQSLLVNYEEMIADPQDLLDKRLAPFLGVTTATALTNYTKVNERPLSAIVSNYDAVCDLLDRQLELVP